MRYSRTYSKIFRKHPLAKELGGEYISQDDRARTDALDLVIDIFDIISCNQ